MAGFDLVIRGGTVADGTGEPLRTADVGVRDGVVAAVGSVDGKGRREIDADGALVTPGFVDIHSHYDGQATWDNQLTPSSWHGVTTVVMGNCGVGFAPVRPTDHARLVDLMEGVEDIPGAALHEGLTWDWESFPDYLDAVERVPHDIDVAAQLPHGALRLYVMGERGAQRDAATPEEIAEMGRLAREAVEAGALGFTTSRTLNHRTKSGDFTPTLTAEGAELVGIARAIGASGKGVLQLISDFADLDVEFARVRAMSEESGRPLSVSLTQVDMRPDWWRELLDRVEQAAADGLAVRAQVAPRPIGALFGLQASLNPFLLTEAYRSIAGKALADRVAAMREPSLRARILDEARCDHAKGWGWLTRWDKMFVLGDPPDYEPLPETSVEGRAQRLGVAADELAYDLLLEDDGRSLLYFPLFNYTDFNLDVARQMLLHDRTLVGLADGGAHVGTICDASFPTTMLTHWGRDRSRGERLDLSWIVKSMTSDTAGAVGLADRGVLAPGCKADVNVIDFERLTLHHPEMLFDLPAGGKRLVQRADGYLATVVSGEVVYEDGRHTGALPGRLVRG
ncbi:MAG TPA: amidohydrolase family protein [Mycobacteriales bacterium]|jgi:N-acyl-D-aspartate/D-glutamate deacylase|nr:amidohydrolase family protein [Mycobacteriales bacterium]